MSTVGSTATTLPSSRRKHRRAAMATLMVLAACGGSGGDATSTTVPGGAGGPTISAGGVSITLPEGWVGADMTGGPEGVGTVMFPDDPDMAEAAEVGLNMLPRAVIVFGLDADKMASQFTDNVNVLADTTVPDEFDLEQNVEGQAMGIEEFSGAAPETEIIELGGREVGRIQADFDAFSTIGYIIMVDGTTYVVTYSFGTVTDDNIALADASVATFTVT